MIKFSEKSRHLEGNGGILTHYSYCVTPSAEFLKLFKDESDDRKTSDTLQLFITEDGDSVSSIRQQFGSEFGPSHQAIAGRFASVEKWYGGEALLKRGGQKALMFVSLQNEIVAVLFWLEEGEEKIHADLSPETINPGTFVILSEAGKTKFYD